MANLKRYGVVVTMINGTPSVSLSENIVGSVVKFEDIAELLKPSHNSDYTAALKVLLHYVMCAQKDSTLDGFKDWCEQRLNSED